EREDSDYKTRHRNEKQEQKVGVNRCRAPFNPNTQLLSYANHKPIPKHSPSLSSAIAKKTWNTAVESINQQLNPPYQDPPLDFKELHLQPKKSLLISNLNYS
ncbi:unnamed protein product, partial [Musa acuminata subsp. burmannicoides]